jgi:hypothetical protein
MMTLSTREGRRSQEIFERRLRRRVKKAVTSRSGVCTLNCRYCVCTFMAPACVFEQGYLPPLAHFAYLCVP